MATEKAVKMIDGAIKSGRRYFGSSGASLTQAIGSFKKMEREARENGEQVPFKADAKLFQLGLDGERKTTAVLLDWIKDKPNAVLIDSVHLKGMGAEEIDEDGVIDGGDTDHVLVLGNTVIIIDSKNWKAKSSYQVTEDFKITRAGKPFNGGNVHTFEAKKLWEQFLKENGYEDSEVHCVVNITNTEPSKDPLNFPDSSPFIERSLYWWKAPFKLCKMDNLIEVIEKICEIRLIEEDEELDVELVADIAVNCCKPYDELKAKFSRHAHML